MRLGNSGIASVVRVELDVWMLGFTFVVSLLIGLVFGAVLSFQLVRMQWFGLTREFSGMTRSRWSVGFRKAISSIQIALTVMLALTAVSLGLTYVKYARTNTGFRTNKILTFHIALSDSRSARQQFLFFEQLRQSLGRLPKTPHAAFTVFMPFGDLKYTMRFQIPDQPAVNGKGRGAEANIVSPEYFGTMGIPLIEGRDFVEADSSDSLKVVIISEKLARRDFPGQHPIGRTITAHVGLGNSSPSLWTIVGVVGDVRNGSLSAESSPQLYVPFSQVPYGSVTYVLRSELPLSVLTPSIRACVRTSDSAIPVTAMKPLSDYVYSSLNQPRFDAAILGVFAVSALVLGVGSLYAVIALSSDQRKKEFSIRIAFGATAFDVSRLVLSEGLSIAASGLTLGILAEAALSKGLSSMVLGLNPTTPQIVGIVVTAIIGITFLAISRPALIASRHDIAQILQTDT
jgi:putative ABC transport system permease protein